MSANWLGNSRCSSFHRNLKKQAESFRANFARTLEIFTVTKQMLNQERGKFKKLGKLCSFARVPLLPWLGVGPEDDTLTCVALVPGFRGSRESLI